ncbi:hypothetical protein BS333_03370 [Vibrio azureus]|uniref:Uncharacterized protein n=2 Tax=Vibrio azureus TaxID=512649 RepID=U3A5Z3_9VIBR|nr:hypothetical protein BS333_03370 [Vibrio azureus]GAD75406.1 hypothetical protein VAZ01S_025_00010 [Vibrio azureus NBRC 104587]
MSAFSAIKDKRRITAVLDCINALNEKDTLTLTGLGRGMKNTKTKVKHCIKGLVAKIEDVSEVPN